MSHIFKASILTTFALAFAFSGLPKSKAIANDQPLLLQFNQKAVAIVIGRAVDIPKHDGRYYETTIEIERIISTIWDESEISQHLAKRITILERDSFLFPNGRYLLWLNFDTGPKAGEYFAPVELWFGYDELKSGIVPLNHIEELIPAELRERMKATSANIRSSEGRLLQNRFGTNDPQEVVRMTSLFARLMSTGEDNASVLSQLAQSPNQEYARIADCLLGLGKKAQRFRFVEKSTN